MIFRLRAAIARDRSAAEKNERRDSRSGKILGSSTAMNLDVDWNMANCILHMAKLRNGGLVIYHACQLSRASSFAQRLMIARGSLSTINDQRSLSVNERARSRWILVEGIGFICGNHGERGGNRCNSVVQVYETEFDKR